MAHLQSCDHDALTALASKPYCSAGEVDFRRLAFSASTVAIGHVACACLNAGLDKEVQAEDDRSTQLVHIECWSEVPSADLACSRPWLELQALTPLAGYPIMPY